MKNCLYPSNVCATIYIADKKLLMHLGFQLQTNICMKHTTLLWCECVSHTGQELYFVDLKFSCLCIRSPLPVWSKWFYQMLVRAACVRCPKTKCSLLTSFFFLSLCRVTFLPEGIFAGFWNFARGFRWCRWGAERRVKHGQTRERGPPSAPAEIFRCLFLRGRVHKISPPNLIFVVS